MQKQNITKLLLSVAFLFAVAACGPSLVIQNVDYAQPLESVIAPDSDNVVHDQRYAIKFSISPVLEEEGVSSVNEVRLIRNNAGYYFVTANGFNHVYVFEPGESELSLTNKIDFSDEGLGEPAFNQRGSHIEMIDRATGQTYNIDQNGRR